MIGNRGFKKFINLIEDIERLRVKYNMAYETLAEVINCYSDTHYELIKPLEKE